MLKMIQKITFFLSFIFLLANFSQPLMANEDFTFYKKYGHRSKQWNSVVQMGFDAFERQDCLSASRYFKQAIADQCQDGLVFYKLAICSEKANSPYTAIQYFELAKEKFKNYPVSHRYQKEFFENYGRALFKIQRFEEALTQFKLAEEVSPPSFTLYYMLGFLQAKSENWVEATNYYEKALQQDTSQKSPQILRQLHLQVGQSYFKKRDFEKADFHFKKVLEIDPNNQEARYAHRKISQQLAQQKNQEAIRKMWKRYYEPKKAPLPKSNPPPPSASQLPPLEEEDPTPPLGNPSKTPSSLQDGDSQKEPSPWQNP